MKIIKILIIIILAIILSALAYAYYSNVALIKRESNIFSKEAVKVVEDNKHPIFKVEKIILYSSAYAIDNSEDEVLQDLDLYQYTDIAIYINNNTYLNKLTEENTISEIYIDNIEIIINQENGNRVLNYKNIEDSGKFKNLNPVEEAIKFNVVHSNFENFEQNYDTPTFYTDCSNPITLGYVNKKFLTNCKVSGLGEVSFDGTILKQANVDLKELNCVIKLTIHLKNNFGEEYVCDISIDNNLENDDGGIYTGYIMRIQNIPESGYEFFKLPK